MSENDPYRTELADLAGDGGPPTVFLTFAREARLFVHDHSLRERFGADLQVGRLAPDEIFLAPVPADIAVRLGKLRVSEFLPDGREVTRAVLQAGAVLRTRTGSSARPHPGTENEGVERAVSSADLPVDELPPADYDLGNISLMALCESELWIFPADTLATGDDQDLHT